MNSSVNRCDFSIIQTKFLSDAAAIFQEHLDKYMKAEPMGVIILYIDDHEDMSLAKLLGSLDKDHTNKVTELSLMEEIQVRCGCLAVRWRRLSWSRR